MTFLTPPEIILYSDTRKENSTNFISNFEKCIFHHILIQIATISMYTGRPHKLKDSYNYKILNLNKVQMKLQHEHVCLEYQKAWIERSWKLIRICTSHFMRLIPTDRYLMEKEEYVSNTIFFP